MKKTLLLIGIFILLSCSSAFAGTWTGKVLDVREGDLLSVQHPEKGAVEVRLYGLDAPDRGQAYCDQAREFLQKKIAGKQVSIRDMSGQQKIDRAVIVYGEQNINELMLKEGFCWVNDKNCNQAFCADWQNYQNQARERKIGLWHDENPVPPFEWRRKVMTRIFRAVLWILPPWKE